MRNVGDPFDDCDTLSSPTLSGDVMADEACEKSHDKGFATTTENMVEAGNGDATNVATTDATNGTTTTASATEVPVAPAATADKQPCGGGESGAFVGGGDSGGASTATSSPVSTPGHRAQFHVHITEYTAGSDQSAACYRIEVSKTVAPYTSHTVSRQYDDMLYLQQCLAGSCGADGLIVPPLPDRPVPPPGGATGPLSPSRPPPSAVGRDDAPLSTTALLMSDAGQRDCRLMEKYLQILLEHPVYGRDRQLERFLTTPDRPVSGDSPAGHGHHLQRPSLLSRVVRGLQPSYATHPDNDEYFQRQRVWLTHYQPALQQLASAFTAVVDSQQRLSSQLNHLTTALNIGVGWNDGVLGVCQRLRARFSDAVDEYNKHAVEVCAVSGDSTLGVRLQMFSRYTGAESDALLRRVALLVDYEAALRSLDKHHGTGRQTSAENNAKKAKQALDKCSEIAKEEIHRLRCLRSNELLEGIREMARAQIHSHRTVQTELAKHLAILREFPVHVHGVKRIPA